VTMHIRRIAYAHEVEGLTLRPLDAEECRAGGFTPAEALAFSVEGSDEAWVIRRHGRMVACWGYRTRSLLGNSVDVWMLSGDGAGGMSVGFARESLRLMRALLECYSSLHAYVWVGHTLTLRWLNWLGFVPGPVRDEFAWYVKERG